MIALKKQKKRVLKQSKNGFEKLWKSGGTFKLLWELNLTQNLTLIALKKGLEMKKNVNDSLLITNLTTRTLFETFYHFSGWKLTKKFVRTKLLKSVKYFSWLAMLTKAKIKSNLQVASTQNCCQNHDKLLNLAALDLILC